ncbi:MAG: universal stress protein [Parachlamydiaceae bacterium]|nr:universal stress protein [Parachlamydiaceae bacterium]
MYKKILVALENSEADTTLLPHIVELAKVHHSELLLVHVADGWVARRYNDFQLRSSEEMISDEKYLQDTVEKIKSQGLKVSMYLALGDPPEEILKVADTEGCDLIAMTSHGHRFFADLILGSTIEDVRHRTMLPMLIVKMGAK